MKINQLFALGAVAVALSGCSSDETNTNAPGSVAISGTPVAGETLTATVSDADGVDTSNIAYQWLVNNVPLTAATSSTFTLTTAQRGNVMRVAVTYIDNAGNRESTTSGNTTAVLANIPGVVTLEGTTVEGETLTATVADDNGLPADVAITWAADGVTIPDATGSTYVLAAADVGKVVTAIATYTDGEGFAETAMSAATAVIAPLGTNTPAEFAALTTTVANNASTAVTGTATVTDVDDGEATFVAQTDTTTTYGTFSITEAGAWTYTLNTSDATVAALVDGNDSVSDSVTLTSADGTTATFDITVTGVTPAPTGNQAAVIRDLTGDDTGELRYSLPEALAAGRLEVTFTRTDDDLGSKDAFISLFNSGNNNAGNILDLRVRDDSYGVRSPSSIDTSAVSVVPGQLHTVIATWEYPNGNTSTGSFPVINLTIDGVAIPEYTVSGSDPVDGVTTISFRFGDNSGIQPAEANFTINEFSVYSDTAGTALVFADDFSGFAAGTELDAETNDASPYATNTEDAVVEAFDDGSGGLGNTGNKYARIVDTLDSDTGELRYVLPAAQAEGKVTFSYARTDDNVGSTDAFFSLFNESNSNSGNILDLRIRDDSYGVRSPSSIDLSAFTVTPGTVHTVEAAWSYPNGNTSEGSLPVVNLTIDGVAVAEYTVADTAPTGGVATVSFRIGSNGGTTPVDAQFWVDDLKIYADAAGTTLVFEDNFEAYAEDFDLNTGANTPYNERTSEAVVKVEE
ncbi:VCBS domain-containing protein [Opacimonas viscosa]|uniref:VCBS domain-containing protein n=1 Tax=Opacimonas viscosa TaxID=2961944 RepID=A0AA41WZK0_9ALTE|nr:VCBS domain-containing protein [Opacimonas viscosa]MCP3429357.1 VCBS domain-containing protein [Opacimonas viscosa]